MTDSEKLALLQLILGDAKSSAFTQKDDLIGQYCIVRSARAGVFAGEIELREGNEFTLRNARRIWYWDGAASLSQMAVEGVSRPGNCKFAIAVPLVRLLNVIEIIPTTEAARKNIEGVPEWKA